MNSEKGAFLATHPPDDRYAKPQAVRGRDKKRRDLEDPVGQDLQRSLRITRHLGSMAVKHAQEKSVGTHGQYRDDPDEHTQDEDQNRRQHIVEEDGEEEHPSGKPPVAVGDKL